MSVKGSQDWYDSKRWIADRCPRCGGSNYDEEVDCAWVWSSPEDYYACGTACADCGYARGREGELVQDAPFIPPGEPGSHDVPSDYEEDA